MYSRLFELIRKEEVVLFVGAGFSINAGYPSGEKLCKRIFDDLSDTEKTEINEKLQLPELTEEFVQIRGNSRNSLITILKEIYGKSAISLSDHEKVKSIPHFSNIITTNYDTLFETVYKESCNVIFKDDHCTYIDKSKANIFKIHGDLSDPNSVIITKSDYTHFFDSQKQTIFWNKIKDIIATYNVLFIGYSFEDNNIISIVEKIKVSLGLNTKEMFLIAPNWKEHKRHKLNSFGIKYFNNTADDFLDQLIDNLKINIKEDCELKRTTPDTFSKFCANYKLSIDLNISGQKNEVIRIKSLDHSPVNKKISFTVNEDYYKKISNNELECSNLPLEISGEDVSMYPSLNIPVEELLDFKYTANEIVFSTKNNIKSVRLVQFPSKKGEIAIIAPDNTLYRELKYQFFVKNDTESTFKVTTPLYYLTVNLRYKSDNKLNVSGYPTFNELYSNKSSAIYWTNFLIKIYSGGTFTFNIDDEDFSYNIPSHEDKDEMIRAFEMHLKYYNNISEIEKILNKRFKTYSKFTENNYTYSEIVLKYLKKETELILAKDYITNFEFSGDDEIKERFEKNTNSRFFLFQTTELGTPIVLNDYIFKLKYKNILYTNCKVLEYKITETGNSFVKFMNETDNIQVTYTENRITQEGLTINLFDKPDSQ